MFIRITHTILILGFTISLSTISCLSSSVCNFSVTLKQSLGMDGFHRNMTYEITLVPVTNESKVTIWPFRDCTVGLHQILPAGIYANPDELNDLRRTNKLNAVSTKTNIEMPADQAEPVTVYVSKKIYGPRVDTWVPLHARYHKAVRFGGFALNEVEPPQLFIRCPDDRLDKCEKPLPPAKYLCTGEDKSKCGWKEMHFMLESDTPIPWQVPVGDLHHYYVVSIITTLAVTIGSLYLLQTIHEYKFMEY